MTKIIVLTDLHMVPEGRTIIGLDPYARLRRGIAHINRFHTDAAAVVVMGDLTNDGDAMSYARVRHLLAELAPPCHPMIGNHDDRPAFTTAFPTVPVDPNGFVQRVVELAAVRLILLDTVMPGQVGGQLCADRLAWLDGQLRDGTGRDTLIFMHHPLHDVGFLGMDRQRLPNDDAFYDVVGRYRQVRYVFAGHIHRTISGIAHGIPFSIFKSPVHQQPMTFDSPDGSLSVDEPGAYGIVFVSSSSVLVHTEDYDVSAAHACMNGPHG